MPVTATGTTFSVDKFIRKDEVYVIKRGYIPQ